MQRVFVSYSRRDKNFAERLARDLSDAGLDVWIDFRQIYAGELWQDEIKRGIERSEMLIICLSPDAVKSKWVQFECNMAHSLGKLIIPVMVSDAMAELRVPEHGLDWLLNIHFIRFENRYEEAFPELLTALPGKRAVGVYDDIDPATIPNPFKGLEAFQQTDAKLFFGREDLIRKTLQAIQSDVDARFVAVVGASGSGKSSLVRAGVIPQIRAGILPDSDSWRIIIFTPGAEPMTALATRLAPLIEAHEADDIAEMLREAPENLNRLTEELLPADDPGARLMLVVDQFEETFTRAGDHERELFLNALADAACQKGGRTHVLLTMRADFFDQLGRYPQIAELFEQDNLVIVTEMTASNVVRTIRGPAEAVGMSYEDGLVDRILDDVRRQPGSLPLLQYALKALFERREGRRLTHAAYDALGGVQRALAQRAEEIYRALNPAQQDIIRRILLRLIEVNENGEVTRRRIPREDLIFQGVQPAAVQDVINLMTAAESRLLVASREIKTSGSADEAPTTWLEVSHEALIREWDRLREWISDDIEQLRLGSEILKAANDWRQSGQDVAYLLTGNRLIRAEEWLEYADANPLQREFIQVSLQERARREALRQQQAERELNLQRESAARLRGIVLVLVVGLIVAVGLTFFAVQQSSEAIRQRTLAEERSLFAETQRQRAELAASEASSFALASSAERALADDENELAVALAVESNLIENPPPQSRLALSTVAYAPGTRRVLTGQRFPVNAVAYSPDGIFAFAGSSDRTVMMWNVNTGEHIRTFDGGFRRPITALDISPDGRQLLTGSDAGMVLWDVATGEEIRMYQRSGIMNSIAISANGVFALSGSSRSVLYWNLQTGELVKTLSGHTETVNDVAFSPVNPLTAASAGRDGTVFVWNLRPDIPEVIDTIVTDEAIYGLAFSPAGDSVITGSDGGRVRLWGLALTGESEIQAASNRTFREFDGHAESDQVRAVAFSPDGRFVASGASDETIILWSVEDQRQMLTLNGHVDPINSIAFNADGRRLLSGASDNTVRIWDTRRSEVLQDFIGHTGVVTEGVYMPGGQTVISSSFDGTLRMWDVQTGRTLQEFTGHSDQINALALSSDGQTLVSAGDDHTLMTWDIQTGEPLLQLDGSTVDVLDLRFLPGDQQVISAGIDGKLTLWDLQKGEMIDDFGPLGDTLESILTLDVSGRAMVTGDSAGRVVVWNLDTDQVRIFERQSRRITTVRFSPDGQRIASGADDGEVVLWDLNGDVIETFSGHGRAVTGIAFTADGTGLLTGGMDGSIRLWDIASGFELRRYDHETEQTGVLSVTLSDDAQSILTGLSDGTMRLWRMLPTVQSLLSWTFNNRYVPPLTCEQRIRFRLTLCDDNGNPPEREPLNLPPVAAPIQTVVRLEIGKQAVVNITGNGSPILHIRLNPGTNGAIIGSLQDSDVVTILDGPVRTSGLDWWRVRKESTGTIGWSAAFLAAPPENLQMLVPLAVFQ